MNTPIKNTIEKVSEIILDAGGTIIGRTRLQKTAYLLKLAGFDDGFHFDYHHYGPYSEELALAASAAHAKGIIIEQEQRTNWGGFYSTYTYQGTNSPRSDSIRQKLARCAASASSITLELAATAAYLAHENEPDPWTQTAQRKPDKAKDGRLEEAKKLYRQLRTISNTLPNIPD